jgi:hypothetical protein
VSQPVGSLGTMSNSIQKPAIGCPCCSRRLTSVSIVVAGE